MTSQEDELEFLKASQAHDDVVVRHYLAIWESYGTPADHFSEDLEEIIRGYLERGRRDRQLASFVAFDEGAAVASVSCQLHAMPYPVVLKPEVALQGYMERLCRSGLSTPRHLTKAFGHGTRIPS